MTEDFPGQRAIEELLSKPDVIVIAVSRADLLLIVQCMHLALRHPEFDSLWTLAPKAKWIVDMLERVLAGDDEQVRAFLRRSRTGVRRDIPKDGAS